MSKNKGLAFKIILGVLAVLLLALIGFTYFVGSYFVKYALTRGKEDDRFFAKPEYEYKDAWADKIKVLNEQDMKERDRWLNDVKDNTTEVSFTSTEGLKMVGHEFVQPADKATNRWIIAVHGYKSTESYMQMRTRRFYEVMGYNVLTMSLRAHAPSDGKYFMMGYKEKDDLKEWTSFLLSRHPDALVVYYGVSMGGATVIMASGSEPLECVVGVIEDCGYTNIWDVFTSELKKRFDLPPFPYMYIANLVSKMKVGLDLRKAESLSYAKKINIPALIIHTKYDDYVPSHMADEIYAAIPTSDKKEIMYEYGAHAEAEFAYSDEYYGEIKNFCDRVFSKNAK